MQVILAGDNVEAEKSIGITHFAVTFVMSWDRMLDDDDHTLDVPLSADVKEKLRVRRSCEQIYFIIFTDRKLMFSVCHSVHGGGG